MIVEATALPEVKLIRPMLHADERGFFLESWNERGFAEHGIAARFVQDNHSRSGQGVLRGIHYQVARPQGKLVRVSAGRAFDVAIDLRRSSPSFGKWVGAELSALNQHMMWVPPGFGHGFLALEEGTDFLYKCTDYYDPASERCIRWDDADLAIDWPLDGLAPILSARDLAGSSLARAEVFA